MTRLATYAVTGGILLALCGCGVVNGTPSNTATAKHSPGKTQSNQTSTPPSGQNTTVQSISIPELPTTTYRTEIPVVLLPEQVTSNSPIHPHPPKTVTVDLPPALKGDFVAYFAYRVDPSHPLYIVVPKDMKPFGQNLVGEDGSFGFTFRDTSGNTFGVGSSGPCYGCAASAGAPFFTEAEKANEQDGEKTSTLKSRGASVTYPQNDVALFAYSEKGMKTYGFNQYNTDMNKHVWGIDFSASYSGKSPDAKQIPWVFQNLIEQNQQ